VALNRRTGFFWQIGLDSFRLWIENYSQLPKSSKLRYWRHKMQVYTYSEAKQKLATVLEKAESNSFIIKPADGWASVNGRHIWSNDPRKQ
jgi:hypothetical protein